MNEAIFLVILFILGSIFGSFTCCQAWRLRYKETKKENPGKRSVCLSCGKKLTAKENIPIISWLFLRGKCKKCGEKIGKAEILSEIGLAIVFVIIGHYFYGSIFEVDAFALGPVLKMVAILITVVTMWIAVVYDAKWGRMPNIILILMNIFAAVCFIITLIFDGFNLVDFVGAIGILPGLYYVLYAFSKEKLVGSGDWLVALAVSLMLPNWFLAVVVLFVSNFVASICSIPVVMKRGRKAQVPFGPFLFIGFLTVFVLQGEILNFANILA